MLVKFNALLKLITWYYVNCYHGISVQLWHVCHWTLVIDKKQQSIHIIWNLYWKILKVCYEILEFLQSQYLKPSDLLRSVIFHWFQSRRLVPPVWRFVSVFTFLLLLITSVNLHVFQGPRCVRVILYVHVVEILIRTCITSLSKLRLCPNLARGRSTPIFTTV